LLTAERDVNEFIEEHQAAIRQQHEKWALSKQRESSTEAQDQHPAQDEIDADSGLNSKGKERDLSPSSSDHNIPKTTADEEYAVKRRALHQRLREVRLVLHRVKFLQGDVYHVLGGQYSAEEALAYSVADEIRRDLLKGIPLTIFFCERSLTRKRRCGR
jgi:E3 ubiquitin-protein ligase SHPRH